MIKSALSVVGTKEKVKSFSGKNVEVKLNLGRNKFASYNTSKFIFYKFYIIQKDIKNEVKL